jgi:hypothetical protein
MFIGAPRCHFGRRGFFYFVILSEAAAESKDPLKIVEGIPPLALRLGRNDETLLEIRH